MPRDAVRVGARLRRRGAHDERQHRHRLSQPLVVGEDPPAAVPAARLRAVLALERPRQRPALVPQQRHPERAWGRIDLVPLRLLLVLETREDLVEVLRLRRDVLRALGFGKESAERGTGEPDAVALESPSLVGVVQRASFAVDGRPRAPGEVVGYVVGARGAHAVRGVPRAAARVPGADPARDAVHRAAVIGVRRGAVAPLVARRGHLAHEAVAHRARRAVRVVLVQGQRLAEVPRVRVIVQRAPERARAGHLHLVVVVVDAEVLGRDARGGVGRGGPRGRRRRHRRRGCRRGGEGGARGYRARGSRGRDGGGVGGVPEDGLPVLGPRGAALRDLGDLGEGVDALAHGPPVRRVLRHEDLIGVAVVAHDDGGHGQQSVEAGARRSAGAGVPTIIQKRWHPRLLEDGGESARFALPRPLSCVQSRTKKSRPWDFLVDVLEKSRIINLGL